MPVLADLDFEVITQEGDAPVLIDSDVTVTDPEGDWDGGTLRVSGLTAGDVVSILSTGSGPGEFQVIPDPFAPGWFALYFQGVYVTDGFGGVGNDLVIYLANGISTARVEAIVEALTFTHTGDAPDLVRTLSVTLTDGAGNASLSGIAVTPATTDPFRNITYANDTVRIALGDVDEDGDLDAIVAVYGDGFHLLRNVGTANAPDFVEDDAGFTGPTGNAAGVTMLDYNNDNLTDLVVGRYDGTLQLWLGDGAGGFTQQTGGADPFVGIDVYGGASPGFADLNGDGFLDIVIARGGGRFDYFTGGAGGFTQQTGGDNPLSGFINFGGAQSVSFADVDSDGDLDFISGNGEGGPFLFRNTGTASAPVFTRETSNVFLEDIGMGSQPVFADIDGDGDLDVVVAYSDGTIETRIQSPASPSIDVIVDGVDDLATVIDDSRTIAADAPISGNFLTNDSDPDNDLEIVAVTVDGAPIAVGEPTTLPDGATLTVNWDGSYQLDLGAVGQGLGGAGSGASNISLQYVISYTLWGGGEVGSATLTISGVDDADVLDGTFGDDVILAGVGADTVYGLDGVDDLRGQDGADRLFGDLGDDILDGGAAGDYLDGGAGADQMSGGAGDDIFIVDDAGDLVIELAGEGNDRVRASITFDLTGTEVENLQLIGVGNINGRGNGLANQLDGNSGANILRGGGGNDIIRGAAGNDQLFGEAGADQLLGGDGIDFLYGDDGADILQGNADNDTLYGGEGTDSLDGGAGSDFLYGEAGNDKLLGGDGNDELYGGEGNDVLTGGAGDDYLVGGLGDDTYVVEDIFDVLQELEAGGNDIVRASVDWVLSENFERLILEGTATRGSGNGQDNQITGNSLANTLYGNGGNDTLNGGLGGDVLVGGTGNDILIGGGGNDVFVILEESVFSSRAPGMRTIETDTITDYANGQDVLDFSAIDAVTATAGANEAFSKVDAFTGVGGQMTITFAAGITTVLLDTDGDAKADYRLRINGDATGEADRWLL